MSESTSVSRRTPLLVGAGVVVLVAALLTWFLHLGGSAPDNPRAAAQQWADAVLDHQGYDALALQCHRVIHTDLDSLPPTGAIVAGAARKAGSGVWRVPLETRPTAASPAGTGTTFTVTVVHRNEAYLVCDS